MGEEYEVQVEEAVELENAFAPGYDSGTRYFYFGERSAGSRRRLEVDTINGRPTLAKHAR